MTGKYGAAVRVVDMAPTLAAVLGVRPLQVVDGDRKMVLGLVWRLILTTQIASLQDASGIVGDEHTQENGARAALLAFMAETGNSLTAPALDVVPEIQDVLYRLASSAGVEYVAQSGGGPTCFAVFPDAARAEAAAKALRADHPSWWVCATHLS